MDRIDGWEDGWMGGWMDHCQGPIKSVSSAPSGTTLTTAQVKFRELILLTIQHR